MSRQAGWKPPMSKYAVRCATCRCEFDFRSYYLANVDASVCPSCGRQVTRGNQSYQEGVQIAQQMYQSDAQRAEQQRYMNNLSQMAGTQNLGAGSTLVNQMGGGMPLTAYGRAQMELSQEQVRAAITHGTGVMKASWSSGVPELDEYDKRVVEIEVERTVITKETKVLGLLVKRRELQLEIRRLQDDLEHNKKQEAMRIAEAVQKQRLMTNEEVAKVKLDADKRVADTQQKAELTITQLQGKHTRELANLQAQYSKELSEAKTKTAEDHYEKLSKALTELHQKGDKNSQFIQELALTMVKKTPKLLPGSARINVKGSVKDLKDLEEG